MRWTGRLQNTNGVWAVSPPPDGFYPNGNTDEGFDALLCLTTGIDNTATGNQALLSNTTGGANTANGLNALVSNTTGFNNTADGFSALCSNTSGSDAMAGFCMRNAFRLANLQCFR